MRTDILVGSFRPYGTQIAKLPEKFLSEKNVFVSHYIPHIILSQYVFGLISLTVAASSHQLLVRLWNIPWEFSMSLNELQ